MSKSIESLERDMNSIRTGRASSVLVDSLSVEYYGSPTPLNQIASISVPEARVIMIQPWDKSALQSVERSIQKSDLGLVPNNDGTVIRLNIPPLTQERRRDLVRLVKRNVEEGHVAIRNIRRDNLEKLRAMERAKEISQDENRRAQAELQKITDLNIEKMNEIGKEKEAEVMEV
jgi:ribosome recycling factor